MKVLGTEFGLVTLQPRQHEFVERFVLGEYGNHCLLIAPVQSGKTLTAMACVCALVRSGRAPRAIVVTHPSLVAQYAARFEDRFECRATVIDRAAVREAETKAQSGQEPWPVGLIGIISSALFRHDDVARVIARTTWDVLVLDEVQGIGPKLTELVKRIATQGKAPRILAMTVASDVSLGDGLQDVSAVVNWQPFLMERLSTGMALDWKIVLYERSGKENEFLHALVALAKELEPVLASPLILAASSSIYGGERALGAVRNRMVHADASMVKTMEGVFKALKTVEEVVEDRKLEALIQELKEGPNPTIVMTNESDTARYLVSTLKDKGVTASRVEGSADSLRATLDEAKAREGVLVALDGELEGLKFGFVRRMIHYDLPSSSAILVERTNRVRRLAHGGVCLMVALVDQSNALPIERETRDALGVPSR